jgi:hypothetical protein
MNVFETIGVSRESPWRCWLSLESCSVSNTIMHFHTCSGARFHRGKLQTRITHCWFCPHSSGPESCRSFHSSWSSCNTLLARVSAERAFTRRIATKDYLMLTWYSFTSSEKSAGRHFYCLYINFFARVSAEREFQQELRSGHICQQSYIHSPCSKSWFDSSPWSLLNHFRAHQRGA